MGRCPDGGLSRFKSYERNGTVETRFEGVISRNRPRSMVPIKNYEIIYEYELYMKSRLVKAVLLYNIIALEYNKT